MAKDKERSINPAQQQHKLDKAKALKKGKAELQARRNEKLARRNPERLQRQIDDLKALEKSGQIKPREKQILQQLETDVRAILKARESLGDKAPQFRGRADHTNRQGRENSFLGKRGRDGERKSEWDGKREASTGSETDEDVRRIPMPKDTPPPIPQQHRRRSQGTGPNSEALGGERRLHELPEKPNQPPVAQTTYESAPQIRDLRKEAVGRFVPNVVRKKQEAVKGIGRLVEPEDLDRLEREGYIGKGGGQVQSHPRKAAPISETEAKFLEEEEARFQRELRHVQIEEVEDEDS